MFYRCSNAKSGPHADYNAYKDFVIKDTTALFLAAAMEHLGLQNATGNRDLDKHKHNTVTLQVSVQSNLIKVCLTPPLRWREWLYDYRT